MAQRLLNHRRPRAGKEARMARLLETITLAVAIAVLFAAAMFLNVVKPRSSESGLMGWAHQPHTRLLV
jgi:hypothetical protein